MKKRAVSAAALLAFTACSTAPSQGPGSNLASLNIGDFSPATGAVAWASMTINVSRAADGVLVKNLSALKTQFQGGRSSFPTVKLPYGRYTFDLQYKTADGTLVYESCNKAAVQDIEQPVYKAAVDICPVGSQTPAGSTPIQPSSDVSITPSLPSAPPSSPATPAAPSTPSASPAAPSGAASGPLAGRVLTGYWQNFNNGAKVLKLADVPAAYNLLAVSFADADPQHPGGVTFALDSGLVTALGGYTDAQFKADIQTLHAQGRRVILSVGGQNGTISVSDAASADNFATSVYAAMQQYGFDGVDIDLENGINPASMGAALHKLAALGGANTIITLAPQTIDMQSTQSGYFQLALAIKDILTIVNTQYYNSGSMNGADNNTYQQGSIDFLTSLAAIQLEGGLRPDQVGLGLPASTSGAGSGYVAPSVANAAVDCLTSGKNCGNYKPSKTYTGLRGIMTWSVNWDASNGYSFANTVSPHYAILP